MRRQYLPFSKPDLGEQEIDEVVDTLRSGWLTTGPKTGRFEKEFARFLGAPAALAVSSCTAGLHVSLVALGIGEGDEVITTPMTFAATTNVIEHAGARPVLADVEPDTLNIDPDLVEAAITPRTRAIIAVHYAGHPAEMDRIYDLGRRHNLIIIEDAAHAFPARYRGRLIGSRDNPASFSFYATKNLTTGEGGALTGSPEFVEQARQFILHGMSRDAWKRYQREGSWYYEIVLPGFKYNMTDIQAAIGLGQLPKISAFQQRRRQIVSAYQKAFSGHPALETPVERPEVEHAWHLYPLRLREQALTIDRQRFIQELDRLNIGTSVHFIPIHIHPYYRDRYGYRPADFPVAYQNYCRLLSLPLYPSLTPEEVEDVTGAVLEVASRFKR